MASVLKWRCLHTTPMSCVPSSACNGTRSRRPASALAPPAQRTTTACCFDRQSLCSCASASPALQKRTEGSVSKLEFELPVLLKHVHVAPCNVKNETMQLWPKSKVMKMMRQVKP